MSKRIVLLAGISLATSLVSVAAIGATRQRFLPKPVSESAILRFNPFNVSKPTAVPISKSVQHDHIVCLEDGKKLTMLKRYLRSRYDLSPEAYRRRWGLAVDYPMVAPAYAARRSDFAKQIGLGKGVRKKP